MIARGKIIFALLCTIGLGVRAQTEPVNELDTKYRPNESSPFSMVTRKPGEKANSELKNAIKYCPTMLLRQKILLHYEGQLFAGLSLNLGLGKAFGGDFIQNAYFTSWSSESTGSHLSPNQILSEGEYYGSSPLISLGARVYFSGDALEGGFFEFNYRAERMSYQISPSQGSGMRIQGRPVADFKMSNFNFGIGIMNTSGKNGKGVHEFYLTVGIKNFDYTRFELSSNSNVSGYQGDQIYINSGYSQARIVPSIQLAYCFGFGW